MGKFMRFLRSVSCCVKAKTSDSIRSFQDPNTLRSGVTPNSSLTSDLGTRISSRSTTISPKSSVLGALSRKESISPVVPHNGTTLPWVPPVPILYQYEPSVERSFRDITRGNIHQSSLSYSDFQGNQCTSMAITALVMSQNHDFPSWAESDIDSCIITGDEVHNYLRTDLRISANTDDRIALEDISEKIIPLCVNNQHYKVVCSQQADGLIRPDIPTVGMKNMSDFGPGLIECLDFSFSKGWAVVLTISEYSIAIKQVDGRVWLFDSHARDFRGKQDVDGDGAAFLVSFDTPADAAHYLYTFFDLDPKEQYSAVAVDITETSRAANVKVALGLAKDFSLWTEPSTSETSTTAEVINSHSEAISDEAEIQTIHLDLDGMLPGQIDEVVKIMFEAEMKDNIDDIQH